MRNKARLRALHTLVRDARYEVVPTVTVEATVVESLSAGRTVTITASPREGLPATLDLAERLAEQGYHVVPHIADRMMSPRGELAEIVDRLRRAAVDDIFVPAGDADPPAGEYEGASGAYLSYITCVGMNRSFISVIAGGFGIEAGPGEDKDYGVYSEMTAAQVAELLAGATSVIITPGYGMAVAQAQYGVAELTRKLRVPISRSGSQSPGRMACPRRTTAGDPRGCHARQACAGSCPTICWYASGSVAPSVLRTSNETSAPNPHDRRRLWAFSPDSTAIRPPSAAAPVSPAVTPASASRHIASRAQSSSIVTATSMPRETSGQASIEGVPQFRPAMIESCGPGTVTSDMDRSDRVTQSADIGSTPRIVVGVEPSSALKWLMVAAARAPHPRGSRRHQASACASH
jgi:hypothetical protein